MRRRRHTCCEYLRTNIDEQCFKKILLTRAPDQWLAAERALRQGLGERLTDSQAGLTTEPTTTTENLVTIGMLRHAKGTLAGCVPGILTQGLVGSFARRQDTLDWIGLSNSPQLCQLQSGLLQKVVFFFGRRPATIRRRRPLHAFFIICLLDLQCTIRDWCL